MAEKKVNTEAAIEQKAAPAPPSRDTFAVPNSPAMPTGSKLEQHRTKQSPLQSYQMTPDKVAAKGSRDNYNIDDLSADDSTDDEVHTDLKDSTSVTFPSPERVCYLG